MTDLPRTCPLFLHVESLSLTRGADLLGGNAWVRTIADGEGRACATGLVRQCQGPVRTLALDFGSARQITSPTRWATRTEELAQLELILRLTRRAGFLLDTIDAGMNAAMRPDATNAQDVLTMRALFEGWHTYWEPLQRYADIPFFAWLADATHSAFQPAFEAQQRGCEIRPLLPVHAAHDGARFPIDSPSRVMVADLLRNYLQLGLIDLYQRNQSIIFRLHDRVEMSPHLAALGFTWPPEPAKNAVLSSVLDLLQAQCLVCRPKTGAAGTYCVLSFA